MANKSINQEMKPEKVSKKEIFSWAMFDFANSGYTTVVLTAVFNSYFVAVIAKDAPDNSATLLWTFSIAISNACILFSAPLIGAISDFSRNKKRFLFVTTLACVISTGLLSITGPGDIGLAILLIVISSFTFFSGENLISAFLPEISTPKTIGKISGYGWTLGYFGGLLVLGLCLLYINWAKAKGLDAEQFVSHTMIIVAICFALTSMPTFFWLKERGTSQVKPANISYFKLGINRLKETWKHVHQYRDLFRFLIAMTVYYCGINTVIVLAAIYAQQSMGFETEDTILLILVVNITAAIGAFLFGLLQDKLGSIHTLTITLILWISAMLIAYFTTSLGMFWIVANLVGLALGSSQSAGRALVGLFSPVERNGEFFGLWGLATKLAAIIGPMVYGLITYITAGDHRLGLLSTVIFFIAGLIILLGVNEKRGIAAAEHNEF